MAPLESTVARIRAREDAKAAKERRGNATKSRRGLAEAKVAAKD
jgi:hypothetical protein